MKRNLLLLLSAILCNAVSAQPVLTSWELSADSLSVQSIYTGNHKTQVSLPLVSFVLNNKLYYSNQQSGFAGKLHIQVTEVTKTASGMQASVLFTNTGSDTIQLENVVPFGEEKQKVYITGSGKHGLSRTHLFIPGKQPVNIIVPDNAWDLGFCTIQMGGDHQLTGLLRRNRAGITKGTRTRFETKLFPGGTVEHELYAEIVSGDWHAALQRVFQERWLYDLEKFDNTLYERKDLQWVRHTYVNHLMMNWDKFYYDYTGGKFHLNEFAARGKKLYGGDDFISLWPTWPTLGLDQRNQFDMFSDLPGGTIAMKKMADQLRRQGTKLFICYNPWDESTRSENHFEGISKLIAATSADGMVLDTKGESSKELQDAADKVRPGVIMYSEGMAVPKDMPGIVSGRVHNALYYAPMLNLNKLIKPEFTIYRVTELYKERVQREFATSFFNGYGTEMNIMAPGQPAWAEEQYKYLGRTSRILRENTYNFVSRGYKPLIETTADSIWVNEWSLPGKTIYTIYSIRSEGYKDYLFEVKPDTDYHFVDLWHHRLLAPRQKQNKWWIEAETSAFHKKYLGTNNEGEVDCIAKLPVLITAERDGDIVNIVSALKSDEIRIWAGHPAYDKNPLILKPGKHQLSLFQHFGRYEGDFVIQLMDKGILLDEQVVTVPAGEARRISSVTKTKTVPVVPEDMVLIPKGKFVFKPTHGDEFISYPTQDKDSSFIMPSFYMDQFPVTNAKYFSFIKASGYKPSDTANYLKHWVKGKIPAGMENFPVVYISYEDAKAYAKWTGKRLPTEIEWQYAAQTEEGNEWPWKQTSPVTRTQHVVNETLTVSALEGIDSTMCNMGDGKLYPVGSYPNGANAFGLQDLVGCVWQLTNDLYMSGSYRYIMMKGGSYFKPSSSWWYVQGGPRELHYRQFLLRVSQGFERNATVGFRCVKDRE
ncbi:MAG: SUMF1/EgtB/PvdO family nonheme iron enzyme [Chitinophagaceae bacterium]|nr:SUMF1/EgtB/PvdO family nonheme iron enzyme [Chitinophagaceae bacterium]